MTQPAGGGFQDGFLEIAKEQLEVLKGELEECDNNLSRLEADLDAKRKYRASVSRNIEQLRNLLNGTSTSDGGTQNDGTPPGPQPPLADADSVVELIRENGAPMHYEQIHRTLVEQGYEIGGMGKANTLLSRFFDDPRLKRVSRGTYDLVRPQLTIDMTLSEKTVEVLRAEGQPLNYREITRRILASGTWPTSGKHPENSVNATIIMDINEQGAKPTFVRVSPGIYGLREWDLAE